MQNQLTHKAAIGSYTPRQATATRASEFVAHLLTFHKHHGLTGAQAARRIQGGQS